MKQIDIIEYLPTIIEELKKGILVNTKNGDKTNSMTIAWGQIGIEWGKMFFTTYIRHGRFTHEQIEATKEFTVSVPLERTPEVAKAIGYIGSRSGREIDKLSDMNLSLLEGKEVKSPAIKELPLTLECKVIYSQEQNIDNIPQEIKDSCYPQDVPSDNPMANKDYHTVYYGEIVNAYILEESDFAEVGVNNGTVVNAESGNKSPKALWITLLSILLLLGIGSFVYNKMNKPQTYRTIVREEMSSVYSSTGLVNDSRVQNFVNKNPEILNRVAITEIRESFSENNSVKTKNVAITLRNKTDKPINDLEVVINVLDKKGNVIEDVDDEVKTLAPHTDYTFNLPIKNDKGVNNGVNEGVNWELSEIKD